MPADWRSETNCLPGLFLAIRERLSELLIADTFTSSFNRLSGLDQKAVKASVFDLQMDPSGNGLQLHRIDKSKDQNFGRPRVNRGHSA